MAEEEKASPQYKPGVRKKTMAIVGLFLLVLVGAGLTAAYTTRNVEAGNVVSFGSVRMQLLETELVEGSERTVPNGHTVKAKTGIVSRIVRVKNVGANDMFVRVRPVMMAVKDDGSDPVPVDNETAEFDLNTSDWTEGTDGWWYYNTPVKAAQSASEEGETTEALMTQIEFNGDLADVVGPHGQFEFTVEAQAVQADNQGADDVPVNALTAVGWPANETTTTTTADEGQE